MGGGRGDLALRQLAPHALRSIGIATGLGFVSGMVWKFTVADPNRAKVQKVNQVSRFFFLTWAGGQGAGWGVEGSSGGRFISISINII